MIFQRGILGSCSSLCEGTRAASGVTGHAVGEGNSGAVLVQVWPGRWQCLSLGYLFMMCSVDVFEADIGVAHQVHFQLGKSRQQLPAFRWPEEDSVENRFRGRKGNRGRAGNVPVPTREDVRGSASSVREGGGAVALLVERFSIHHNLRSAAPLASYRELEHVTVLKYGPSLRALRELVGESGQDPAEFATHGRICTTFTPDWKRVEPGSMSERLIQREGMWKSGA